MKFVKLLVMLIISKKALNYLSDLDSIVYQKKEVTSSKSNRFLDEINFTLEKSQEQQLVFLQNDFFECWLASIFKKI